MRDLTVLTGDIVRSQRLTRGELDQVFVSLSNAADMLGNSARQNAHFTRIRGDSWQAVTHPAFGLRAVFLMRAAVRMCGKGFETRIGVAVGPGMIRGADLADADGESFISSGHALDKMKKNRRVLGGVLPGNLAPALPLAEALSARWTARQAEVACLALALPAPTQDDVALRLEISQAAVQKHWSAAAISEILDACDLVERSCDESVSLSA